MNNLVIVPLGHTARDYFITQMSKEEGSLLVVPSRFLKRRAIAAGARKVCGFDGACDEILRLNGYADLKRISRRSQELIITELINKLNALNGLDYFKPIADKKGLVKAIAGLIGEFSRSGAELDDIKNAFSEMARTSEEQLKDAEFLTIYKLYREYLKQANLYDVDGLYRLTLYILQQTTPVIPWQNVYFSEFYTFDGLQTEIIKALGKHCNISVGLVYENNRPDVFSAVEATFGALSGFLSSQGLPINQESDKNPILKDLCKCCGSTQNFDNTDDSIRLFNADSPENELRTILRDIKKRILNGERPDDFVIYVRSFADYTGFRRLCDEYGLPSSAPQTATLATEPIIELIVDYLGTMLPGSDGVEYFWQYVFSPLRTIISKAPYTQLRELYPNKYYSSIEKIFTDVKNLPQEMQTEDLKALANIIGSIPKNATVADYCKLISTYLDSLNVIAGAGALYKEALICAADIKHTILSCQAINDVLEILTKDYQYSGLADQSVYLQEFITLFKEGCSQQNITIQKGSPTGITFAEVAALQGVAFKHVYILGLAEGKFPATKNQNWLYSDSDRQLLTSLGIELFGTAAAYAEDRFFFYSAVSSAIQSLTLSWYADDKGSRSPYLQPFMIEPKVDLPLTVTDAYSTLEAGVLAAETKAGTEYLNSNYFAWPQRSTVENQREAGYDKFSGILHETTLLKDIESALGTTFDATRLETYAFCPFAFLVNYLWRAEQFKECEESIDPSKEGNLLHKTLEFFFTEYSHTSLRNYDINALKAKMNSIFEEVCSDFLNQSILPDSPFWSFRKQQLAAILETFLIQEYYYQSSWPNFVPANTEWSFGYGKIPPLVLTLNDKELKFRGRIDRIDTNGSKLFITDYKRNSTPTIKALENGFDLQLPLYLLATDSLLHDEGVVIGGGYYSINDAQRKSSLLFIDDDTIPFGTHCKPFEDEVDKWQAFKTFTYKRIQELVNGMYTGCYKTCDGKNCPAYCPGIDICRCKNVFNIDGDGEADE